MEYPYAVTLGVFLVFLLVAVLPPRMHLGLRLLIQAIMGAFIYFRMPDALFSLPFPDDLPISDLSGGGPGFNWMSFGFLCFALGAMMSLFVAGVRKFIRSRKAEV